MPQYTGKPVNDPGRVVLSPEDKLAAAIPKSLGANNTIEQFDAAMSGQGPALRERFVNWGVWQIVDGRIGLTKKGEASIA